MPPYTIRYRLPGELSSSGHWVDTATLDHAWWVAMVATRDQRGTNCTITDGAGKVLVNFDHTPRRLMRELNKCAEILDYERRDENRVGG